MKELRWGKRFESEDVISTAVMATLHHLNKDEHRAAIDHLPHSWEKCVDSAGDYIVYWMYVSAFWNISSVVLLYFVITIKSYTVQ